MAPSPDHPVPRHDDSRPHLIIVGAGFAGLAAARALKGAAVRVTVIDRNNYHLFQPLLYQVATAGLSAAQIAEPIRDILRQQHNVTVLLGEVQAIDVDEHSLRVDGQPMAWDGLIVAAGARNHWFGHDHDWAARAVGLKTIEDAFDIRNRVLLAYEEAERTRDPDERRRLLTFAVIGAGPTGVELAGALAEIACHTMARNFRRFDPRDARVLLIEGGERVLSTHHPSLSERALRDLAHLGVEVRLRTMVRAIDDRGVILDGGRVESATVLWAAGVRPAALADHLPGNRLHDGRVVVGADLSLPEHPDVFVVGDMAAAARDGGAAPATNATDAVPGVAPAAQQMGAHAARQWLRRTRGEPTEPFRYRDKGQMATIGRSRAVLETDRIRMAGPLAWLAWVFVHLMALVGYRNRLLVFLDWLFAYASRRRGARVIHRSAAPRPDEALAGTATDP